MCLLQFGQGKALSLVRFNCALLRKLAVHDVGASLWRKWFRGWIGFVAEEATHEAAIEFDGFREVCDGEKIFVKSKCRWAVVQSGERVVKNDGVSFVIPSNGDTIKSLIFDVGPLCSIVDNLIPVTN